MRAAARVGQPLSRYVGFRRRNWSTGSGFDAAAGTHGALARPIPQALRGSGLLVICDGGHKRLGGALSLAVYGFVVQKQNDLIHKENGLVCRGPAAGSQMAELGRRCGRTPLADRAASPTGEAAL